MVAYDTCCCSYPEGFFFFLLMVGAENDRLQKDEENRLLSD